MPSVHANLDQAHRAGKARKMLRLLRGQMTLAGARVLEIGTGSGVIAQSFREQVGASGEVWAVDVVDQRLEHEGVQFRIVTSTALPFQDRTFDLVISNHVIEHVGDLHEQEAHLREIHRVLRPGGWLYLATPNRYAPIEPHFRLPLLSWLPQAYRTPYVRAAGRGEHYDCWPLTRGALVELVQQVGLEANEVTRQALDVMLEVEDLRIWVRALAGAARRVYPVICPFLPTFIFLARRPVQ